MTIKQLLKYIEENKQDIKYISIENYDGEEIANLKNLDIADIEENTLKLQLNTK